ncbi:molybdenum cofactor biosynthesis prote [Backusella circina FSU 941]|nr:molybdenum cofactor biosynthesis prote [Backusella circina FSU 941]
MLLLRAPFQTSHFLKRQLSHLTVTPKPKTTEVLIDKFQRQHNYLRISLTERCNLRCTYCMPEEGVELSPEHKLLSTEEIIRLATLFVSQGVSKIRLTGGEPTVRSDIVHLVQELGKLKSVGLQSLAMTSNGVALKRKLPAMVDGGLDTLNVSLDTLDPHLFQVMTRRNGYQRVVEALDEAIRLDMAAVKINTVVMRGVNDQEVLNFTAYTKERPVNVRFIEYMPFDGNRWNRDKLVPYQELIRRIESMYGRLDKLNDDRNDTTKHYKVPGYQGKIGFISSMTDHFCGTCNRLRITADGSIKVCLFGNTEISLRDMIREGKSDKELLGIIGAAVKKKKKQHAVQPPHYYPLHLMGNNSMMMTKRHYSSKLTHTDPTTGEARMVSVTDKDSTKREAKARGRIVLPPHAYDLLKRNESHTIKGNVLTVAQIAGIQAAKSTSQLIPLCHPLLLGLIDVRLWLDDETLSVECESTVQTTGKTGVEMEALTATSVSLLTVYDMCKAATKEMRIENIRVVRKSGGKSGPWTFE